MTEQQILQRLIEAALTEGISIPKGMELRLRSNLLGDHTALRVKSARIATLSVASAAAAAVIIPAAISIRQPQPSFTDTCLNADEARYELQSALSAIQQPTAGSDLLDLLK